MKANSKNTKILKKAEAQDHPMKRQKIIETNGQLGKNTLLRVSEAMTYKNLEKNQELKARILKDLLIQDFEDIDLTDSVDQVKDIWIYFWRKYKVSFCQNQIKRHLKKVKSIVK